MIRKANNFTIPEEAEPILPHHRPRSSGSFRPPNTLVQTTYGQADHHRRLVTPAPAALRVPTPRTNHAAQSFTTSGGRPVNLAQRSAHSIVNCNRPVPLGQRSTHSLVMGNCPPSNRTMYRHPQLLRPTTALSASRILRSSTRTSLASSEGARRVAQGRITTNQNRRNSNRKMRRAPGQHVISSRPPKIQRIPHDQSSGGYSSDDTCHSYTTIATSKATTNTAVGSPPELSKRPYLYVKEFAAPTLFQSNIDLGAFSKRQLQPYKRASNSIYWALYVTGFLLFPAWIIGYVVAALAAPSKHKGSMKQLVEPNPIHLRWKDRFLNTLLIFIAITALVVLAIIISHPAWFPFKSKILSIGKY